MIAKVEGIDKVKGVRKIGRRRRITMKGLYYRKLIKRMFAKSGNIGYTDRENNIDEEPIPKERQMIDTYA